MLLDADFNYSDDTYRNTVNNINDSLFQVRLVTLYLPITAGLLGLVLVVVGLMMVARSGRRPEQHAVAEDRTARHLQEV